MSLSEELALVTKLISLGVKCPAFQGLTTYRERRDNIHAVLAPVAEVTYSVRDGKRVTMQQQFDRIYGCPV